MKLNERYYYYIALHTFGDLDDTTITKTPELPFSSWLKKEQWWEARKKDKFQLSQKYKFLVDCFESIKSYIVEEIWSGGGKVESTWEVIADTEATSHPTSFPYAKIVHQISRKYRSWK